MRVLMTVRMDTAKMNEMNQEGKTAEMVRSFIEEHQPEACYFGPIDGRRTAMFFLEVEDSSMMPVLGERFFQTEAEVRFSPVMNSEELQRGLERAREATSGVTA